MAGSNEEKTVSQGEMVAEEKKYRGIVPKKPLISNNRKRAYFDSADWALSKIQGANDKIATESLKPKLKPTPYHQLPPRKPTCISDGHKMV